MSLASQIGWSFECAACGCESVEPADKVANRKCEYGAQICRVCEEKAKAWVVSIMVDSVIDKVDPTIVDPYLRTSWFHEEFRPPVERASNWYTMTIMVILTIAAGVLAGLILSWLA